VGTSLHGRAGINFREVKICGNRGKRRQKSRNKAEENQKRIAVQFRVQGTGAEQGEREFVG
jgi:hypothetical protein